MHCAPGNLYGGVESFLVSWARSQHVVPEIQSEFALCFRGRLHDDLQTAGATVHLEGPVRLSRPWTVWRYRRHLRDMLASGAFDAVVSHGSWCYVLAGPAVRRSHARSVMWVHDSLARPSVLDRKAARRPPDLLVANSRYTASGLKNCFAATPSLVVPCAVSPPELEPSTRTRIRKELNTPEEQVVIIIASRLEEWKGHRVLVDALGHLSSRKDWTAWVVGGVQKAGEQAYLESLQEQVRELGIGERVLFLGQRRDVPALLQAADICCQPNTQPEPFGIAFVEALYAGLPVVTSKMGGALEIVNDSCGMLVPANDAPAVSRALESLICKPLARETLRNAARLRAEELCLPKVVLGRLAVALRRHLLKGEAGMVGTSVKELQP